MRTIAAPETGAPRLGRAHLVVVGVVVAALVVAAGVVGLVVLEDEPPSRAAFCEALNEIYLADAAAAQVNVDDVELVRNELTAAARRFERLQDLAPADIADAVDVVADFARGVAVAARDHPTDEPFERAVALSEASAGAPDVEAALSRLDSFRARSC